MGVLRDVGVQHLAVSGCLGVRVIGDSRAGRCERCETMTPYKPDTRSIDKALEKPYANHYFYKRCGSLLSLPDCNETPAPEPYSNI